MLAEGCRRRSNTRRGADVQSTLGPCRGGECISCVAVNISCFGRCSTVSYVILTKYIYYIYKPNLVKNNRLFLYFSDVAIILA